MSNSWNEVFATLISGPYWTLNKTLVRLLGLEETLWLTDLCSKWAWFKEQGLLDEDGFFYNSMRDIENDTTLSRRTQNRTISVLVEHKILEVKKQGIPTLALDVEYGTSGSGQIRTRVQAFLEMLEAKVN